MYCYKCGQLADYETEDRLCQDCRANAEVHTGVCPNCKMEDIEYAETNIDFCKAEVMRPYTCKVCNLMGCEIFEVIFTGNKIHLEQEKVPEFNSNYWDCECKQDFIHNKEVLQCDKCGTIREDQPDSRAQEVKFYLKKGR